MIDNGATLCAIPRGDKTKTRVRFPAGEEAATRVRPPRAPLAKKLPGGQASVISSPAKAARAEASRWNENSGPFI